MKKLLVALVGLLLVAGALPASALTYDVIALYTDKSLTKHGLAGLQDRLSRGIALTNTVHSDSATGIDVNVLAFLPSPVQEQASIGLTHAELKNSTAVKSLRDQYGADLVLLISEDTGGYTGWASMWYTFSGSTVTSVEGFAIVISAKMIDYTLVHEFGHLQGAEHNRENTSATYPGYHYGYRVCAAGGFLDIMSYKCPNITVPQIGHFSDPRATWNGQPLGIDWVADPSKASDAVRAIKEFAPKVVPFRSANPAAPTTPPFVKFTAAPTTVLINAESSTLTWSTLFATSCIGLDGWSGDKGKAGTASTGPLPARTTYTLKCVGPGGTAEKSVTVAVKLPPVAAPPDMPSNLVATANGLDVDLSWELSGEATSSVIISRSKQSTSGGWTSPMSLATLTGPATSYGQTVGAPGTFKYFVAAKNAKGSSAKAEVVVSTN